MIGPSRPPPDFSQSYHGPSTEDSDDDSPVGPAPPPGPGDAGDETSYGERVFLEREQRRQQAEAEAKAAADAASSSRPEWMLAPPPSVSFTASLTNSGGALKARGFQQNTRVQRSGGPSAEGADDMSLWTETPQQRMERLKNEVHGKVPAAERDLEAERGRRMAEMRDREIRDKVTQLDKNSNRTMSLLEQHQAKRRNEHRAEQKKKKTSRREGDASDSETEEDRERRRRRRKEKERDDRDRESSRRHRHRSRSRSRSPERRHSSSSSSSKRHREDDRRRSDRSGRDRSRSRSLERDSRHKEGSSSSSSRHKSHRKPSRSPSPDARSSKSKDKERKKEKKLSEDELVRKAAATVVWDREKAMSFVPLMDQAKRAKTLRDAQTLGDRFGGSSGGSKFL